MQDVSEAYKKSMSSIGRNRGYIKVSIGLVNSEAQNNLKVSDETEMAFFSNPKALIVADKIKNYATCENKICDVDGETYFIPDLPRQTEIYNNGIVTEKFLDKIVFDFSSDELYDVVGFTIDFGDNYPTSFIISNGDDSIKFSNSNRYFSTDTGLQNVGRLEIIPLTMLGGAYTRLRIYSLSLGIANTFTNEDVMNYEQNNYVSAISDSLPSSDVSLTIQNYDQRFNPDNDHSQFAFFEEGQEVKVAFGYDVDGNGEVEWLPETVSYLKEWKATDKDVTFRSTDIFDSLSGTYQKGLYRPDGITAYELAEDILADAGVTRYRLDRRLHDSVIYNPIPVVSHTEALQILANACRCVLYADRDGAIVIESNFVPSYTITSNENFKYSNPENAKNNIPKDVFAFSSYNYTDLDDEKMVFVGDDISRVGYVTNGVDGDGDFSQYDTPSLIINMEYPYSPDGYCIKFKDDCPCFFEVGVFLDDVFIYSWMGETQGGYYYGPKTDRPLTSLPEFNKMVIWVYADSFPYSRKSIESISFIPDSDYSIDRNMMMNSVNVNREDKIKIFSVAETVFYETTEDKTTTTKFDGITNGEHEIYFSSPSYNFSIAKKSGTGNVIIKEFSNYRLIFELTGNTDGKLEVETTYREYYVDDSRKYSVSHNQNGIEKTWKNPLVSNDEQAKKLEKWLSDYLILGINYEFDWRGDPRTDANDTFLMELKTGELVNIKSQQSRLAFNGAWSGSIKARKVVN